MIDLHYSFVFQELPLDDNLRKAAEDGHICFLCLQTKFWLLSPGVSCSMCCHLVCGKCSHAMMIPADQFFATPVLLHSPGQADPSPHQDYQPSQLAGDYILITARCPGSVASSTQIIRREDKTPFNGVNTVTTTMESLPPANCPSLSLPPAKDKYSTLPRKTGRRWSMISARTGEKEKMEDSALSVCTDCKHMLLQLGFRV